MARKTKPSLLILLSWVFSALAATPDGPQSAIAVKVKPLVLRGRAVSSGAQLVKDLILKAQATSPPTKRNSDFEVLPLITSLSPDQLTEMVQTATKRDPTYTPTDFTSWYQVIFPTAADEANSTETGELLRSLARNSEVLSVQRLRSVNPPVVKPADDPLFKDQGHLTPAAVGVNAPYAWGFPGGDGAGTTVIDVERGWLLEHEDLVGANITLLAGLNVNDRYGWNLPHGTAVLGEMLMVDNKIGGVGIVPAARGHVVGTQRDVGGGRVENQPEAIMDAARALKPGDVMLLEMQTGDVNGDLWPVEVLDAEFEAIRLATALGIVVVEPAANGGQNGQGMDLDKPVVRQEGDTPRSFLNKGSKDFRESGAILVGGGSSTAPHKRMEWSNFGSRVDVFAWGENILTTSVNVTDNYAQIYERFAGTSGAAPIIAGVALSVQGMVNANKRKKFNPKELRDLIKKKGTPTVNPAVDKIGVQPDLKALIDGGYLK